MTKLYPLTFSPVYKDYLWGGDRIVTKYNREQPAGIYAESWEVSDRPEGDNVVNNGALSGQSLRSLCETFGQQLLGTSCPTDHFPLLIKLIDSKQSLSVQVHPNDETAARLGGEAKTEMWYMLDTEGDAAVYAGLKAGTTPEDFEQAIADNAFGSLLNRLPVTQGDVIFIPGGRVHAIDAGCLILEVQQNSNTTYRIYDWGRVGADGKPRELHVKQALEHIDWVTDSSARVTPKLLIDDDTCKGELLLQTDYFILKKCLLKQTIIIDSNPRSFRVLFVESGAISVQCETHSLHLDAGQTVLLPARIPSCRLIPESTKPTVLSVTLP